MQRSRFVSWKGEMTPRRVHCIFNTPCRICCKARTLFRVESRDALDESNGADGDQVLLIGGLRVVFLHNVRHEAKIALDEHIARLQIALCGALEILPLLPRRQRLRKGTAVRQAQGIQHAADDEPYGQHKKPPPATVFPSSKSIYRLKNTKDTKNLSRRPGRGFCG